jgi:hypothetical protein
MGMAVIGDEDGRRYSVGFEPPDTIQSTTCPTPPSPRWSRSPTVCTYGNSWPDGMNDPFGTASVQNGSFDALCVTYPVSLA